MRMKKLAVMALATALSVGSVMTASAAWLQEGSNWRYQNDNGTFQTGTWFRDADGRWYHFDNNGIMQKGWFQDADGKWYFLAYNGVMQVGLIKVDNQVYYMGTSGDLFIGDMKIGNTTYNFGLYGTTNGQPSVPASATYGGNGNQSLNGGGGGSSSTSGGDYTPSTPEEKVDAAISDVKNVANSVENSTGGKVKASVVETSVDVENKTASVEVEVAAPGLDLSNATDKASVSAAVTKVVKEVVDSADKDTNVTINADGTDIPVVPYPVKKLTDTKIKELVNKYVKAENYEIGTTADVTVTVAGVEMTYSISLSK